LYKRALILLREHQLIFRQLSQAYSILEVPNYYEAATMRLIMVSIAKLRITSSSDQGLESVLAGSRLQVSDDAPSTTMTPDSQRLAAMISRGKMVNADLNRGPSDLTAHNDGNEGHRMRAHHHQTSNDVPLSGGTSLQVTHNRLPGSGQGEQTSWLLAFNWSLFPDPFLVWSA